MACELLRRRIPCRIIDANDGPTPLRESRALVLWERTLEIFRDMAIADNVLRQGREVRALNLFAGGEKIARFDLDLKDEETRYRYPLSIPQGATERILANDGWLSWGGRSSVGPG